MFDPKIVAASEIRHFDLSQKQECCVKLIYQY